MTVSINYFIHTARCLSCI